MTDTILIEEALDQTIKAVKFIWPHRNRGIMSWEGGWVYPRNELRRNINIIREYREILEAFNI